MNKINNSAVQKLKIASCFLFLLVAVRVPHVEAGTSDVSLDSLVPDTFTAVKGDELRALCAIQNRPCGLEEKHCLEIWSAGNTDSPLKIHFKNMTVAKTLDMVARMYPGYRWESRDGVINIEPIRRLTPDLLSRKLDKVSIHGMKSNGAFSLVLAMANIHVTSLEMSSLPPTYGVIDLELNGVTVRAALNAIAKADGQVMWEFGPDDKRGESAACFHALSWRTSGGNK